MIQSIRLTPWKLWTEVRRLLLLPLVRLRFLLSGVRWGTEWRIYGVPILHRHRRSRIDIGDGFKLRCSLTSNPLGPKHPVFLTTWEAGSALEIGDDFAMTGGVICVAKRITIGDHVMIGANCTIVDTDFHPIDPDRRRADPMDVEPRPVTIEDDVFVGMNSIILKGVTIGRGAVIGAGSVVTRDVPPYTIAAGNPAVVVRSLERA